MMDGAELKKYRLEFSTRKDSAGNVKPMKQKQFANIFNISQQYLSQMERGERPIPPEFEHEVKTFFRTYYESDVPLRAMIDYLRLSFFHTTPKTIIEKVLGMDYTEFAIRETGLYQYDRIAYRGNIWVFYHQDKTESNNVLVQMSGTGCREYEMLLTERNSDWYQWFRSVWENQGNVHKLYSRVQCTRFDIALDEMWYSELEDHYDLYSLQQKRREGLLKTSFKRVRCINGDYGNDDSGALDEEGFSIYFGSRQSEVHFNFYEKRYELARKNRLDVIDALIEYGIYNRFEIRLMHEKAKQAVDLFLQGKKLGEIGAGIINNKMTIYEQCWAGQESFLKVDEWWARLFRQFKQIGFSMKPQYFSIDKTERWFELQVFPSLKLLAERDRLLNNSYVKEGIANAELDEKKKDYLEWLMSDGGRETEVMALW